MQLRTPLRLRESASLLLARQLARCPWIATSERSWRKCAARSTTPTVLGARYVRVFSYYFPEGEDPAVHRMRVIDRLERIVTLAEATDIKVAHENERGICGDTGAWVSDLFASLSSDSFVAFF